MNKTVALMSAGRWDIAAAGYCQPRAPSASLALTQVSKIPITDEEVRDLRARYIRNDVRSMVEAHGLTASVNVGARLRLALIDQLVREWETIYEDGEMQST